MNFAALLHKYQHTFAHIVPLETSDKLYALDLTAAHTALTREILDNANAMTAFIRHELERTGTRYAIGGYAEHRNLYDQHPNFGIGNEEPRRLHLGIDIWGSAGTPVFAPLEGRIHSFKNNAASGDYGGTIIMQHELDGTSFHTLYGHLALRSLEGLYEGKTIGTGERLAEFGEPHENGSWSPHLHFQVISDMEGAWGDYPGVCRLSERGRYLANCPDSDGILCLNRLCD